MAAPPKRFRNLSLKKAPSPKVVVQRMDIVPPPDSQDSLPESVSPAPTISLITEDEEEERTVAHFPKPIGHKPIKVEPSSEPSTSTAITDAATPGPSQGRNGLPPLFPISETFGRPSGKNFAMLAASIRSPPTPLSPSSSSSSSSSSEEDDGDFFVMCEEEAKRRQQWAAKCRKKIPKIEANKNVEVQQVEGLRQELADIQAEIERLRKRSAAIEGQIGEREESILRYNNELQRMRNWCQ